MTRCALLLLLPVMLACCGGGSPESNSPQGPAPVRASPLARFDAGTLSDGFEAPDLASYWAHSEKRNGNTYPVSAKTADPNVIVAKVDAANAWYIAEGGQWAARASVSVLSTLDDYSRRFWNNEQKMSSAALILFADKGARWQELLQLCRDLVDAQIRNLWLVTLDGRDGAHRLLPLFIDTAQLFNPEYQIGPETARATLRLFWADVVQRPPARRVTLRSLDDKRTSSVDPSDGWAARLLQPFAGHGHEYRRVQLELRRAESISGLADVLNALAPLGLAEIEPYWPVLIQQAQTELPRETHVLADFQDRLKVAQGLNLPALSDFWRASAADTGLPAATILDEKHNLQLRLDAEGTWHLHEPDGWRAVNQLPEVIDILRRSAGDPALQVVLAADRAAAWIHIELLQEAMVAAGLRTLQFVTQDALGPRLRLLEVVMAEDAVPEGTNAAAVVVSRKGPPADGDYTVTLTLDGAERQATGISYPSRLVRLSSLRDRNPDLLRVKMPGDEPLETLFTILNSVSLLGMREIRIGR
ncbi:MAG: hypothetical protein IT464_09745 [Planctomycetes bacterium]|nr:hypothetical protein [Planctomycetota bacterium]